MRQLLALCVTLSLAAPAGAENGAGDFDYWILALTWAPSWCAREGRAAGAPLCDGTHRWAVHGLWPQYERGWPEWCAPVTRDPTRAETGAMADIMGDGGAAWYQWRKHGRCAGLAPETYFGRLRKAWSDVVRPPEFAALARPIVLSPEVVESAFVAADPARPRDGVTIKCRDGRIEEVRLCLDRDLAPRPCAPDARRDCDAASARMVPPPAP